MHSTVPLGNVRTHCNETRPMPLGGAYLEPYRFRHWAVLCDDQPLVLPLSPYDLRLLREDAVVADRLGIDTHPEKIQDWSVFSAVQTYLAEHPAMFAKVAEASPKDGRGLHPITTTEDLWQTLAGSRRVLTFLLYADPEHTDLVLRPWNPAISPHNEYRVFVRDGQVVGISQQHIYQVVKHADPLLVVTAVTEWVNGLLLPQASVVLDVYHDETMRIHLIEANPWLLGSGSALFRWDELVNHQGPTLIRSVVP